MTTYYRYRIYSGDHFAHDGLIQATSQEEALSKVRELHKDSWTRGTSAQIEIECIVTEKYKNQ